MFVGLVKDPGSRWGPPDEPARRPRRDWSVPWRALAWVAAVVALFAVSRVVGGVEGYVLTLVTVAVGSVGVDRQLGPNGFRGMRDYQS